MNLLGLLLQLGDGALVRLDLAAIGFDLQREIAISTMCSQLRLTAVTSGLARKLLIGKSGFGRDG